MLPAQINVTTEHYGDYFEDSYKTWKEKYVFLEKVFLVGGDVLKFRDCNLNESKYCTDEDGNSWTIELIQQKIN